MYFQQSITSFQECGGSLQEQSWWRGAGGLPGQPPASEPEKELWEGRRSSSGQWVV